MSEFKPDDHVLFVSGGSNDPLKQATYRKLSGMTGTIVQPSAMNFPVAGFSHVKLDESGDVYRLPDTMLRLQTIEPAEETPVQWDVNDIHWAVKDEGADTGAERSVTDQLVDIYLHGQEQGEFAKVARGLSLRTVRQVHEDLMTQAEQLSQQAKTVRDTANLLASVVADDVRWAQADVADDGDNDGEIPEKNCGVHTPHQAHHWQLGAGREPNTQWCSGIGVRMTHNDGRI